MRYRVHLTGVRTYHPIGEVVVFTLTRWSIYDRGQEFVEQVYHGIDFAFIDKDAGSVSHQVIDVQVRSYKAVYKALLIWR